MLFSSAFTSAWRLLWIVIFYEEEGHFYHFDGSLWIMHEASCYLSIVVLYHKPAKFYVHCQAVPWRTIKGITFVAIKIIGRNKECLVPEIIYFCIIKKLFLLVCKCSVLKGQENKEHFKHFVMLGFSYPKLCAQGFTCNKIVLKWLWPDL